MKKKIAILGATHLQLPLVLKAMEYGIETHCFAWDNDEAICKYKADYFYDISVLESEKILAKCLEIKIHGITTIATDICIPVICYIAQKMGLTSNSIHSGFISTNKQAMRESFLKAGINSPKFMAVDDINSDIDIPLPLIIKPTDRSGSRGVTKVENTDQINEAIRTAIGISFEKKALVEEFVDGSEVSVKCISWHGKHYLLAITDKVTTGEPYFVELQHHQPSALNAELQNKIANETFKALNALEIQFGASHAEFKITRDGKVVAIEVGARMGGDFIGSHLVMLSTGYDFLKGVIDVALNQFVEPDVKTLKHAGVYFLSKDSDYLMPYFKQPNSFDIEKKILNNTLQAIKNSNDRSGYLIYADEKKRLVL